MATVLSSGSPGPLDNTMASKFLDKMSLELVLQGRLIPSFAIYKSGNEYSLEIYPETLPDGKERYVLRRIRNCESSRPKKFPTVSEKVSKT